MKLGKNVIAVHDLSCTGKCSLGVVLPILTAAGNNCAVLPTSIYSTHTGGFTEPVYHDCSELMLPICEHWKRENLEFDILYSGYMATSAQAESIQKIYALFSKPGFLYLCDPAMADNGHLYSRLDQSTVCSNLNNCQLADIITPNVTEAFLLLNRPYEQPPYTWNQVVEIMCELQNMLGPKMIVLTGIIRTEFPGCIGVASLNGDGNIGWQYTKLLAGHFHGTGDIFSAVLLTELLKNKTLQQSVCTAMNFTYQCVLNTLQEGVDPKLGLCFERQLFNIESAGESSGSERDY